jgi:hypothetical protein
METIDKILASIAGIGYLILTFATFWMLGILLNPNFSEAEFDFILFYELMALQIIMINIFIIYYIFEVKVFPRSKTNYG